MVSIDIGRRFSLKDEPCEVVCPRWRLYGANARGFTQLLAEVNGTYSSSIASGYAPPDVRRVWGEVFGGGTWHRTAAFAVDSARPVLRGVDAAGVAVLLGPALAGLTVLEVCLPLNSFTRTAFDGSVAKAVHVCEEALSAGASVSGMLARLTAKYGSGAVAVLVGAHVAANVAVDAPPTRSDAPPRTTTDGSGTVPFRAGDVYQPRIRDLTDLFVGRKLAPSYRTLSRAKLEYIARQCYARAVAATEDGQERCDRTPIFATGSTTPGATQHDFEVMLTNPTYAVAEKGQSSTWYDKWYRNFAPCRRGDPKPDGADCDEFPFGSVRAGGPAGDGKPQAHLKLIDGQGDNQTQGSLLSSFYKRCGVVDGKDFYVLPMVGTAVAPAPPTTGVCL